MRQTNTTRNGCIELSGQIGNGIGIVLLDLTDGSTLQWSTGLDLLSLTLRLLNICNDSIVTIYMFYKCSQYTVGGLA